MFLICETISIDVYVINQQLISLKFEISPATDLFLSDIMWPIAANWHKNVSNLFTLILTIPKYNSCTIIIIFYQATNKNTK
jgi:hypothetical protein